VYVTLEAAPWVWRLAEGVGGAPSVTSHTGVPAHAASAWTDDEGRLYLGADLGVGLVHTLDMAIAADAIEAGRWTPKPVRDHEIERRFGFVRAPTSEPR